jgi:hypothetical protein
MLSSANFFSHQCEKNEYATSPLRALSRILINKMQLRGAQQIDGCIRSNRRARNLFKTHRADSRAAFNKIPSDIEFTTSRKKSGRSAAAAPLLSPTISVNVHMQNGLISILIIHLRSSGVSIKRRVPRLAYSCLIDLCSRLQTICKYNAVI